MCNPFYPWFSRPGELFRTLFSQSLSVWIDAFRTSLSTCFALWLARLCLSRLGRCHRMPIKTAVCAAFAEPLASCTLRMALFTSTALVITRVLAHINRLSAHLRTCPVRQVNHSRQSCRQALSYFLPHTLVTTIGSLLAGHLPVCHSLNTSPNPHVMHVGRLVA